MTNTLKLRGLIIFCFIFCSIYSCRKGDKKGYSVVEGFKIDTIKINFDLETALESEVIDSSVKIVYLKSDSIPVFSVDKLVFSNQSFFISDNFGDRIFCFDLDGQMKFFIEKPGYGPEEYIEIDDIGVNFINKTLEVLDTRRQRIVQYDLSTGAFVSAKSYDFFTKSFSPIGNGGRLFHNSTIPNGQFNGDNYNNSVVYITDSLNNLLKTHFPQSEKSLDKIRLVTKNNIFRSYENLNLNYVPLYSSTIYNLHTENFNLKPHYYLDFGPRNLNDNILKSFNGPMIKFHQYIIESGLVYSVSDFYETRTTVYFTFYMSGEFYQTVYDKDSKKSLTYRHLIRDKGSFRMRPSGVFKDNFVTILSEERILNHVNFFESKFSEKELEELADYQLFKETKDKNISENPVLIFTRYKSID